MLSNNIPTAPVTYTSNARRGSDLTAGSWYQLELIGGKGAPAAEVGVGYLATDVVEKGQRLMVHTSTGSTFWTDESDIYSL